jgi:hypothetical protein
MVVVVVSELKRGPGASSNELREEEEAIKQSRTGAKRD